MNMVLHALRIGLLPALLLLTTQTGHAGSATWLATPATGDWGTAANWTTGGPPNGSADTATFDSSTVTGISVAGFKEVNGIVFNPGASAFTVTVSYSNPAYILTVSGVGITNKSGITQNFVNDTGSLYSEHSSIHFTHDATAGSQTAFTNKGAGEFFGEGGNIIFTDSATAGSATFTNNRDSRGNSYIFFEDTTSAGNATFINRGGSSTAANSFITFFDSASADNGTFINSGAVGFQGLGGSISFSSSATAGNATITNNAGIQSSAFGATTEFDDSSTGGSATLIANGGSQFDSGSVIRFLSNSTGGTARVEVFGNGSTDSSSGGLDISRHAAPGVTIGSIEGDGLATLGSNHLTVGANNISTVFSGIIQDSGAGGGSLSKIGRGNFTLSNANTYTGGTTIRKGSLFVTNRNGSATGTGTVEVKAGTLGGTGIIAGDVKVGTGTRAATLAPGVRTRLGTLTLLSNLTLNSTATCEFTLNSDSVKTDQVVSNGLTINSGALVALSDLGTSTLGRGTVFTIINNTSGGPISGTFTNLPDNSTFTVGMNSYRGSYLGGDGNDLTLTVQ